jgi:DnaK suppressor protein
MHTLTDDKLRNIRAVLLARDSELRDRVQRVHEDLRRAVTPLPADAPDAAIVVENDEILHALNEAARSELEQIRRALDRIETGTYGMCEECGKRIDDERLRIVPYALNCRHCAS